MEWFSWINYGNITYIPRIGPHFSCSRIGRSIVGTYKSLTDTWIWKLGLWQRNPFLGIFVSNFRYWFFAVQAEMDRRGPRSKFNFLAVFLNPSPFLFYLYSALNYILMHPFRHGITLGLAPLLSSTRTATSALHSLHFYIQNSGWDLA
jgi:hypothetical protein